MEARELQMYADNTAAIVTRFAEPVYRSLERKMARGVYDRTLAVKAMRYVADEAARGYAKDYGSPDQPWHKMFTVADRNDCAAAMLQSFENEVACGNGWLAR